MEASVTKRKKFKKRGLWIDAWIRLRKNKTAVFGMILALIIVAIIVTAPLYISYDDQVIKTDIVSRLKYPAEGHLLGTDEIGRDIFARIVWGGRISLFVGFFSVVISLMLGGVIGAIAAYYGGKVDGILMRCMDIFMAIPYMLLMITIVSVMKPSVFNLTLAIAISSIPGNARMVRAQVLSVKSMDYIEAVRAQGASDARIIMLHIMPNAISPLISQFVMSIAGGIMAISSLSFIGLGIQAPNPEWGAMLSGGRSFIRDTWHITAFPGLAIVITVIACTLVGDGLRDALDPKMKS